jgi:predicted RNase H-like HicB family nuclease
MKNKRRNAKPAKTLIERYLSQPYSRILIPQEDGRFAAEILEFPGCFAEGEDPGETYTNLEEAARRWLSACVANGTPVPPPLTSYEVSGKFALRLPKGSYLRAAKAAAREGVSLNQYITAAVAEQLGAHAVTRKVETILTELRRLVMVNMGIESPNSLTVNAAELNQRQATQSR